MKMMRIVFTVLMALQLSFVLFTAGIAFAADTPAWDKTFPQSGKVTHTKVRFHNRFGIDLAADLYAPKDFDRSKKYPAIIVGPPYGGVKEQTAGLYAQSMAERGFITLAFDPSFNGESGGTPRHLSSPEIFVEDFSAAVDFIGTRPFTDKNRIGIIGVCGSGGFAISAAQVDRRIKAVAAVSMYDISRVAAKGFKDSLTDEERKNFLDTLGRQRWKEYRTGAVEFPSGEAPETIDEVTDPIGREFYGYYSTPRGFHPNSIAQFTMTSQMAFMNFPLLANIKSVSPRAILFVIGENAHSRYFSEDAYKEAAEPKELYIVPGVGHVDLYDGLNYIPFDKLVSFFGEYLK
jgi:fermentation-respiration switch protein FrsA (DUF1100 family)